MEKKNFFCILYIINGVIKSIINDEHILYIGILNIEIHFILNNATNYNNKNI